MSSSKIIKGEGAKKRSITPYTAEDMGGKGKPTKAEEARKEADAVIRQAKARAEALEMDAYNQGMAKGQEEGRKIVTKKIEPLFDTLRNAITELTQMRLSMIENHQKDILEMVFLITEKIIHRSIQASPDIVLDTVRAAGRHLMETDEIHLRLHPSDFEYIREIEAVLSGKLSGKKGFHIIEDSAIERGGVIIETEFGEIDATIRSQIERMKEAVSDHD
ncbi:MAG: FliH/SctL family protein [Desulfomonilia bacterium]|jgi:flagellar assembly protein FliH|nr:FliH/SctL family protein [Deltaproteobacteria bacterium]MDX9761994.1 FliH/SctL family protein [Desulfomonilia bacterium]HPW69875.1 FliH/SctL family protein [Deltaproteobacteria bacterium]